MIQKTQLLSFLILFTSSIFSQTISPEVISTSGNYHENANGSLSWTIGEAMTETYSNGTTILTQGFQQSKLTAISIFEYESSNIEIKIFPNPTTNFINLHVNDFKNLSYQLFEYNGKLISLSDLQSNETKISFQNFAFASYFLKIMNGSEIIKTYQIIKQ